MMVADPEFDDLLQKADIEVIRKASTKTTHRLTLYQKLFNLSHLHGFCADVDCFLSSHKQRNGVHCELLQMNVAEIMERIRSLGLWEAYLRRTPLEEMVNVLSRATIPLLQENSAQSDIATCGYCWHRNSHRT